MFFKILWQSVTLCTALSKKTNSNIKVNLVDNVVEMEIDKNDKNLGGLIDNYNSWLTIMSKQ